MGRGSKIGLREICRRIREIHQGKVVPVGISLWGGMTTSDRIELNCTLCGFEWSPYVKSVLYSESGCPQCARNMKMTKEDFITRAKRVHQDRFDYSLIKDFSYRVQAPIKCNDCGHVWNTRVYTHLQQRAECPDCRKEKTCTLCGHIWREPGKCPLCYCEKRCTNCSQTWYRPGPCPCCNPRHLPKTYDEFLKMVLRIHKFKYNYHQVRELQDEFVIQCTSCKHHIKTTLNEHLSESFTCPYC